MAFFRKAVLASTMIAAGLASTTGAAFANDDDNEGDKSVVNAQGTDVLNQLSACDNYVPILNVLPIDDTDANADVPLLNKQGDGNASTDVPNADQTCTPESTQGSVDSSGGDTADADTGAATRGED